MRLFCEDLCLNVILTSAQYSNLSISDKQREDCGIERAARQPHQGEVGRAQPEYLNHQYVRCRHLVFSRLSNYRVNLPTPHYGWHVGFTKIHLTDPGRQVRCDVVEIVLICSTTHIHFFVFYFD